MTVSLPFSDDFTRANETPVASPYFGISGYVPYNLSGNKLVGTTTDSIEFIDFGSLDVDVEVSFVSGSGDFLDIYISPSSVASSTAFSAGEWIYLEVTASVWNLYHFNNGTITTLATGSGGHSNVPAILRVRAIGTTYMVFLNGVHVGGGTHSYSRTSTVWGFHNFSAAGQVTEVRAQAAAFSFIDNFTRADNAHLGAPWLDDNGGTGWLGIVSNHAVPNTYDSASHQLWDTLPGGTNGTYALTVTSIEVGGIVGIVVRRADAGNHVLVEITPTLLTLYQQVSNSYSIISSATVSLAANDVVSVDVDNASIVVKLNGVTECSGTTTLTGGRYGLFAQQGSSGTTSFAAFSFTAASIMLPFADNFNRANGAVGSSWNESSGGTAYQVVSNVLAKTASTDAIDSDLRLEAPSADFDEQITLTVGVTTNYAGLHGRAAVAEGDGKGHQYGDYTYVFPDPVEPDNTGHLIFFIWDSGARVDQFVTNVPQPTVGDVVTLRMRVVGQVVTCWFNGTKVFQGFVQNTNYSANTFHGVSIYATNGGTLDNYSLDVGVADSPVSLPFADNFTRANNPYPGDPYIIVNGSEPGALGIVSNQLVALGGTYPSALVKTALSDIYASCNVTSNSEVAGLVLRYNTDNVSGDRVGVYINGNGNVIVDQIYLGSYTSLATLGSGYGTGSHFLEAYLVGTRVLVYVDHAFLGQVTVTSTTITVHGLVLQHAGSPSATSFGLAAVPAVTLPFTDTFVRADAPGLGYPWVDVLGHWKIVSNVAVQNGGAGLPWAPTVTAALTVIDTTVADHYAQIITTSTTHNTSSVMVRYQDNQNFIILDSEQDHGVYEVVANTPSLKMSLTSSPGDTLRLRCIGTNVEVFLNNVSQGSFTTTLTGTRVGVYGYDNNGAGLTAEMAQFSADNSVSGSAPLAGNIAGHSTVGGSLTLPVRQLAGAVAGTATVTGDLFVAGLSGGHIVGATTVSGHSVLSVLALKASVVNGTQTSAAVSISGPFGSTSTIAGSTTVVADMGRAHIIYLGVGDTIAGTTAVTGDMIFHILHGDTVRCGTTVATHLTLNGLPDVFVNGSTIITSPGGGFRVALYIGLATAAGVASVHGRLHIYPQDFDDVHLHLSTRVNGIMLVDRDLLSGGHVTISGHAAVTARLTWTGLLHPQAIAGHTVVRGKARAGFGGEIIGYTSWWGTISSKYRTSGQTIAGHTAVYSTLLINRMGGIVVGNTHVGQYVLGFTVYGNPIFLTLDNGLFGVAAGQTKFHSFWSSAFVWYALGLIELDRSGRNPPYTGTDGSVSLTVLPNSDLGLGDVLYCGTGTVGNLTVDRPRMILFVGEAGASFPATMTVACTAVGGTEIRTTGTGVLTSPVTQMPVAYG